MGHQIHPVDIPTTGRPPLPQRIPGAAFIGIERGLVIATIHAVAEHLAEHPELPAPDTMRLGQTTTIADLPDHDRRTGDLARWAHANDAKIGVFGPGVYFPGHGALTATLPLVARDAGRGIAVTYRRIAQLAPGDRS